MLSYNETDFIEAIETYIDDILDNYADIWGEENILNLQTVDIRLQEKQFRNTKALGITKLEGSGWETWPVIYFDPLLLGLQTDEAIQSVVAHGLAHCCVFFDYHTLESNIQKGHGPHWRKYVDKLNSRGLNIQPYGDEDYLDYLFGKI